MQGCTGAPGSLRIGCSQIQWITSNFTRLLAGLRGLGQCPLRNSISGQSKPEAMARGKGGNAYYDDDDYDDGYDDYDYDEEYEEEFEVLAVANASDAGVLVLRRPIESSMFC